MNKEKKKSDPVIILLDLVIVAMVFVILVTGLRLSFVISHNKRASTFMQEPSMMSFEVSNNNYAGLIQGKYINKFNGDESTASYNALADYVEALSKYKVYIAKGYDEKASEQEKIMARARVEMGDLTIFADKVDVMFDSVIY